MRLHELISDLPIVRRPEENPNVTGLHFDSRQIQAGDLFVAMVGEHHDGRAFSGQAANRGACAVLGPGEPPSDLTLPWVEATQPRALLGPLAARLYDHPDQRLLMVGITGTNGKSTVVALLQRMLERAGHPCGILGTLGYRFQDHEFAGVRTTPEASDLFRILKSMHDSGAQAVAMEVSSHALILGRVAEAGFNVAVFTNLSHDHLDFHGDLEQYFAAKRRLFDQLKENGLAVVPLDDPYGRRLADELPNVRTYGPGGRVEVTRSELDLEGTRATLATPRGALELESNLIGRFNLDNLLAAAATAEALGLPHDAIVAGTADQPRLTGRLEPIDGGQPFPVLIDYAHTPAALEAALRSLREIDERKIVLVFGCGGDRDRSKRPMMGELAGQLADLPIATTDNPRSEDPLDILHAVETGLERTSETFRILPDRAQAIQAAVAHAASHEGWSVMVAGKGHEEMQILGAERVAFSDRQIMFEALQAAGHSRASEAGHR